VWPNPSCSIKKALSPSRSAANFAFASGVIGSAYRNCGGQVMEGGPVGEMGVHTHRVSDDENWVLELLARAVCGKLFD